MIDMPKSRMSKSTNILLFPEKPQRTFFVKRISAASQNDAKHSFHHVIHDQDKLHLHPRAFHFAQTPDAITPLRQILLSEPNRPMQDVKILNLNYPEHINVSPLQYHRSKPIWEISSWALFRPDTRTSLTPLNTNTASLGTSQAGVRGTLWLNPDKKLGLTTRFYTPFGTALGKEAALGLTIKPIRAPLTLIIEQRLPVDHGSQSQPEALLTGGIEDRPLKHNITLSGYAQTGIVGIRHPQAFADGALSLMHPLLTHGDTRLKLGGGIWGSAQSGASRLDVGPEAQLRSTLQIGQALRLNIKIGASYRLRAIGNALPHSGPALSIGMGF